VKDALPRLRGRLRRPAQVSPHSSARFPYGGVNARTLTAEPAAASGDVRLRPLLVDVKQAARLLGIGRTTLYELINAGAITPVHIGRCVRFPVAELERFVAGGCTVVADTRPPPKAVTATARRRAPRRAALREVTPRLFDPAS